MTSKRLQKIVLFRFMNKYLVMKKENIRFELLHSFKL